MAEKKDPAGPQPKVCFVICPIDAVGSATRERSDQILDFIIEPVATACGYDKVERADRLGKPGIISRQVIDLLLNADLVVADLSTHNPNVMWELGIRHAVRKPLVQMIDLTERIPFDVGSVRTIFFDWKDMRSVDNCKKELAKHIGAVEEDPSLVDNPLTDAIALTGLNNSGNSTDALLAQLIDQVQSFGSRLAQIETSIRPPSAFSPGNLNRYFPPRDTSWAQAVLTPNADTPLALRMRFEPSKTTDRDKPSDDKPSQ